MKKKSNFSFIKLFLLLSMTTISMKAIGLFQSEEDALSIAWGLPLERHLSTLSETGRLDEKHTPWADFHWSAQLGSIANRWTVGENKPLDHKIVTIPELSRLSPGARRERLKSLSPAEKLDLVRLKPSFPLLRKIQATTHHEAGESDSNLEIGWAIASTHLLEPQATEVKIKVPHPRDPRHWLELEIPFASSDVKALLAYYFGKHALNRVQRYQVGANCSGDVGDPCASIDPASFHLLLTNMISKMGRSFILDLDPSSKTMHRPVVGYESDIRFHAEGHYRVTTKIEVSRLRAPDWKPYGFYNLDTETYFYEYNLEVNTRGEIVRGQWLSDARPGFAWRSDLPQVEKDFRELAEQIYQPVKKARDLSAVRRLFE